LPYIFTKVNIESKTLKNINMAKEEDDITKEDLLKKTQKEEEKELRENEKLKAQLFEMQRKNKILEEQLETAKEEKRKPGITTREPDGTEAKKKRPNSWGLSDLVMPPYTKGRVAIYRALGQDGVNPATNLPVEPFPVQIPGEYMFYDKFDKDPLRRDKIIKNVTGSENYREDGERKTREVVEDVIMERGFLQVFVEKEYPLYVFMELHPMNISNRHRPSGYVGGFERVDINMKSPASQAALFDLGLRAALEIKDMDKEKVLKYAAAVKEISTSAGRPTHEIKYDLQKWAAANPQGYYQLNKNDAAAIQINVLDAINFGLIEYRIDKRGYVFVETEEVICSHTPAQEPMAEIVKYMARDDRGKEWYSHILERMNYWGPKD
jgi:hypothetical protein